MGYYGGSQGRLVSTLPGLRGVSQHGCDGPDTSTGLVDCWDWSTTTTLSTTADWPTGVYWLHLVRDDNGADNAILLVVRDDGHAGDVLYTLPTATYQAYNPYGGKSLYDFNSNGATTVSGTTRAVKVSYDRPYAQTYNGANDFFPYADQSNVSFLERNGYDLDYTTSTDLHANGAQVASHKAFVSPAHDEYWSAPMRSAVTAARDSGTGLFWLGSNQVYWRIRFESSPHDRRGQPGGGVLQDDPVRRDRPRQPDGHLARPVRRQRARERARRLDVRRRQRQQGLPARRLRRPGPYPRLAPHAAWRR